MIIPCITTAWVNTAGEQTLCVGSGALLAYRVRHKKPGTQTIIFRDGRTRLMTIFIPQGFPAYQFKITKMPGRQDGIPFEHSLVVSVEEDCELEVWYALGV